MGKNIPPKGKRVSLSSTKAKLGMEVSSDDVTSTAGNAKPSEVTVGAKRRNLTKAARTRKQILQRSKPWPPGIPRPQQGNSLYDPDFHPAALIAWTEKEGFILLAVQKMGIAISTHNLWRETHPEYAEASKAAHTVSEQWLSRRAQEKCRGKNPDGDAGMIKFLLERRHSYIQQSQVDLSAKVDAKVATITWGEDMTHLGVPDGSADRQSEDQ